jgi:hypothetical protein
LKHEDGGPRKWDAVRENAPNEPTDQRENAPNEPTRGGQRNEDGRHEVHGIDSLDRTVPIVRGTVDGDESVVDPVANEEAFESYEDALKRIRLRREEVARQLNEQARREAAHAMAARRARRREQMARKRKPVNPPDRPEGPTEGKRMYEIAAQRTGELEERTKASLSFSGKHELARD